MKTTIKLSKIPGSIKATKAISNLVKKLKQLKKQAKVINVDELAIRSKVEEFMADHECLTDIDGTIAVTWIKGEPTQKLDVEALKENYPLAYQNCLVDVDGRRIFLVK